VLSLRRVWTEKMQEIAFFQPGEIVPNASVIKPIRWAGIFFDKGTICPKSLMTDSGKVTFYGRNVRKSREARRVLSSARAPK
jgi:hypothetical protein